MIELIEQYWRNYLYTDGYRFTGVPQPMVHPDTLTAVLTTTAGWQGRQVVDGGATGPPARRTRLHADPFDQVESVRLRLAR